MLLERLWRYGLVLSKDNSVAEDLVQVTCVRALERSTQFEQSQLGPFSRGFLKNSD